MKTPAKKRPATKKQIRNVVTNGLQEALFGFNLGVLGTEMNQVDTLYKNNRWYQLSNFRQLLSESYVEHGIIQTVVDVPVDDAFRGGVEIKSKQLEPEQIETLQIFMEEQGDLTTIGQTNKWNRLFGGAGTIILTGQDSEKPLEEIKEGDDLDFRAVDMWELFYSQTNLDQYRPDAQMFEFEHYNYYGKKLHKSRVLPMRGITPPSFIRPRMRGWGVSVVEVLINSFNQYLKGNNLIFEVLDEFKVDVYRLKGLVNTLLAPGGTQMIQQRMQMVNAQKNYQNAITMDSEDEFVQKELSFAGIAETMTGIKQHVASDVRIPLTKLFGISAAGFSSGEDDIENYNAMVESTVRAKSKFEIIKVIRLRCAQQFGFIPDDLSIEFRPMRILSSEMEENVKTQRHARCLSTFTAGLCTAKEFKEAVNKDNLLPIQLDMTIDALEPVGAKEIGRAHV